ncbi:MAG: helix-turn-helix domain-containing protein [Dermatophilaceae bacterium]
MRTTKNDIARSFMGQVARFGYRRSSVDDVAKDLRVSKKTIYGHFRSKEQLYAYAVAQWAAEQRARVESRLSQTSAAGQLREVIGLAFEDAAAGFAATNRGQGWTHPPELLAQANDRVFAPWIRDLIIQGNQAGEFDVDDPDLMTAFGMAIAMEGMRRLADNTDDNPVDEVTAAIMRLVTRNPPKE